MHLAGHRGGCEHEPNWARIFPVVAKPGDAPEAKATAMQAIRELKPTCQKLLMNPTACYGCPSNPLKDGQADQEEHETYNVLIGVVARMVDAAKLGWLDARGVTDLEFDLMRMYEVATRPRGF